MARISMLTLSDKICTIANGNRSGHDLIVLNCLLKPILLMVTTECIGKKKIGKSIWSKTSSKIVWNTRQIPFKIHQTEISKFTNFLQHLNSILQLPKYRIKNCPTPLNTTNFRPAYGQISFPATDVWLQNAAAWANVPGQWSERGNQVWKWLTHNIIWLQALIHRRVESASVLADKLLHFRVKGISVSSLG